MVYMTSLPGGWIADRLIGQRRAVLWGGILIASGHFSMAFPSISTFYLGLMVIVLGTGLLKGNISVLVGKLYAEGDERRDAGFSIYYMGINLGAFIAPLVCGFLGQRVSWHAGFAAAGVGMALGVVQYVLGGKHLGTAGLEPAPASSPEAAADAAPPALNAGAASAVALLALVVVGLVTGVLAISPTQVADLAGGLLLVTTVVFFGWLFFAGDWTPAERRRLYVIGVFFLAAALFWSEFEQAGSTLNLFADRNTRTSLFGLEFPSSWFQSANAIFIIALAPVFAWLWLRLGPRQPSSPIKFSIGLIVVGAGFVVMMFAAIAANGGAEGQPELAAAHLPAAHGRRALPQSGRIELDDQAGAGARRGADDGRLVPGRVGRQLLRRPPRVLLRGVVAARPVRRRRRVRYRLGPHPAGVFPADQRIDGRSPVTFI